MEREESTSIDIEDQKKAAISPEYASVSRPNANLREVRVPGGYVLDTD